MLHPRLLSGLGTAEAGDSQGGYFNQQGGRLGEERGVSGRSWW